MAEKRIYLSLKESEELIFEKYLSIDNKRLEINQASRDLSVDISVEPEYRIENEKKFLIFSSSVEYFQIPDKEENLFLNHYKLPQGLVKKVKRKVRDQDPGSINFPETKDENEKNIYYLGLRNGLLNLLKISQDSDLSSPLSSLSLEILNSFFSLSAFRGKFIASILNEGFFPLMRVKTPDFKPDPYFRYIWWGKFIIDHLLEPELSGLSQEEVNEHKAWFKNFTDPQNFEIIEKALQQVPSLYEKDLQFLIGYYIAALNYEAAPKENFETALQEYIFNINTAKQEEILLWGIFFQSLFKDELSGLYFIPALRDQIFQIENLAFDLGKNKFQNPVNIAEFKKLNLPVEEQLKQFIQLQLGVENVNPKKITTRDMVGLFENNLSENNRKNVGLVLHSEYEKNIGIRNTCWLSSGLFQLNLYRTKPKEVTFYSNQEKADEFLKDLKIKIKPINKLIDKKKKILIGFLNEKNNKILKTYSYIIQAEESIEFEKLIFIWLVDRDVEEIQSTSFDLERKSIEKNLSTLFNNETILLIKNSRGGKDDEIKRSLKNLLSNYKLEQLEVIDENFDELKASWLIAGNPEYIFNDGKKRSYYSYLKT